MTKSWHMARVASRRELPKPRKMHGPVGPAALLRPADGNNWTDAIREVGDSPDYPSRVNLGRACKRCGVHVCSCKPVESFASRYAAFIDDMPQRTENKFNFPVMSCIENGQSAECKPVEDEVR